MAKRALVVGINRYADAPLRGCVNDAEAMHGLLTGAYGFPPDDVRVLCDGRATTQEIRHRLGWLVDGAKPGDVLVFHYSGHGSQIRDRGPQDELADHKDEILCPADLDWKDRVVTDDDLGAYFRRVPAGARLYVVLDCCHSGTGTRDLRPPGEDANPHPVYQRFLPPPFDIEARAVGQALPARRIGAKPPEWLRARVKERNRRRGFLEWLLGCLGLDVRPAAPPPPPADRSGAVVCPTMNHVLVSGCRSDQTSADAHLGGRYMGALTHSLTQALSGGFAAAPATEAHAAAVAVIKRGGFPQDSQLEGPEAMLRQPLFT